MTPRQHRHHRLLTGVVGAAALSASAVPAAAAGDHPGFTSDVFPIFAEHCVACHQPGGEGYIKSGLDMRSYDAIMKGTKYGPVIVPGDAFTSNLAVLIEDRARPEIRMPHARKPISRWQRVIIRRWINAGAKNN
ncbi:MAG: c-type cytochrome domain-containing protein [Rhodospirillales bacterium]